MPVGALVKSMVAAMADKGKGTVKVDLMHEPMGALDEQGGDLRIWKVVPDGDEWR